MVTSTFTMASKNILTTNTSGNRKDRGMVARIKNIAVSSGKKKKKANPSGVFGFNRQNKEKL